GRFQLQTSQGPIAARHLVVATGGMAIPQLGATDFALKLARQFGLRIVEPRPALVPLVFNSEQWAPFASLSGVALEVKLRNVPDCAGRQSSGKGKKRDVDQITFLEDLLFTHRGLSGPAILQISTFWNPGESIEIDLSPDLDI